MIVFFIAKLYRALVQECNQSLLCFLMFANVSCDVLFNMKAASACIISTID